jgi:hypothetical protein
VRNIIGHELLLFTLSIISMFRLNFNKNQTIPNFALIFSYSIYKAALFGKSSKILTLIGKFY